MKNLAENEARLAFVGKLQQLTLQNKVDEAISALNSETGLGRMIRPDNQAELNLWNLPGGYYLKRGEYPEAEQVYNAFYKKLLEQQEILHSRLHKGMPLHNLAISLFFQGKTEIAMKYSVCAYIEDVITSEGADSVEQAPASTFLRGLCGVHQELLIVVKTNITIRTQHEIISNPELVCNSGEIADAISKIQKNYTTYIPDTWKWEISGQAALEKGDYETSHVIYEKWFSALLKYQDVTKARVHKGHPLFNNGLSRFLAGNREEAFNLFLLAYIEDAISALRQRYADNTPAFRNLSSAMGGVALLREIEQNVFKMKEEQKDLNDPLVVLGWLANLKGKADKEFEEQRKKIDAARDKNTEDIIKDLSTMKAIDEQSNNTLYVLKRWNSATPRFPHVGKAEPYGGGYFLVWKNQGIVIDPGYDFLKIFYENGFGIRNINMIIVTHAHDDHCQDLEAIFSVLYKLNKCGYSHTVDLIASEGVQIKYSRLLTIMKCFVKSEILGKDQQMDPSTISGKQYDLTVFATRTEHNEEPWMKTNTGFGMVLILKKDGKDLFKIGLTGDTALREGIAEQFSGVDLLIEHIGTYGTASIDNHLCDTGCSEILKRMQIPPKLVVVSEFGEEIRGHRVDICTQIETIGNRYIAGTGRIPVFAADLGLRIRIPSLKIFCFDTKQFEEYTTVTDKEINEEINYVKKE